MGLSLLLYVYYMCIYWTNADLKNLHLCAFIVKGNLLLLLFLPLSFIYIFRPLLIVFWRIKISF